MKHITIHILALLIFFAGLGVNVVKFGCDACRDYMVSYLGVSCAERHQDSHIVCCAIDEPINHSHSNTCEDDHQDCTSERLSIPLDSYVQKIQLSKANLVLPYFADFSIFSFSSFEDYNKLELTNDCFYFPKIPHNRQLAKLAVFII